VRISDQLMTGQEGVFSVSTKEGVAARVTIQARWAIDRASLLRKWSALPPRPGPELVSPIVAAAFRALAPRYEVASLVSDKREEFAATAAKQARERLAESGIVLKEVLISDLTLPEDFERGREAMVDEIQKTERMEVTLKLKAKEVEQTRLEAEAQKARVIQQAEAAAQQRVIQARGESEAMKFILEQKHKEIDQKKLEAQAERETRVQRAQSEAEASKIAGEAEALRRRTMADAEAYAIRKTSEAQFENLKREAELVSANPLLIPKTFADRISDKVQVILTPTLGGETFTDEVVRRAARQGVPETPPAATRTASKSN
jgi:regulator of protease activity HflC (stomatin/prohibitin superfamily)